MRKGIVLLLLILPISGYALGSGGVGMRFTLVPYGELFAGDPGPIDDIYFLSSGKEEVDFGLSLFGEKRIISSLYLGGEFTIIPTDARVKMKEYYYNDRETTKEEMRKIGVLFLLSAPLKFKWSLTPSNNIYLSFKPGLLIFDFDLYDWDDGGEPPTQNGLSLQGGVGSEFFLSKWEGGGIAFLLEIGYHWGIIFPEELSYLYFSQIFLSFGIGASF